MGEIGQGQMIVGATHVAYVTGSPPAPDIRRLTFSSSDLEKSKSFADRRERRL
jgi:hypothetical protein